MTVTIELATGSPYEAKIRDRLLGLLARYDLRKWQFTDRVRVEANAPSHSHPVLTLTARFATDELLLSTYLHEQLHWFTLTRGTAAVEEEWRRLYPDAPADYPEGCGSRYSTYLHFTIAYFEYRALLDLLGTEAARRVIEDKIERPYYRAVYRAALHDFDRMTAVVTRHGLAL
ncbi:MAG TPA: hypothetical protein VFW96_05765 [Thermomicrobiales bacterium]|nr:hypothetical protein [Thermomicrobiales bacterium]